MKHLIAALLLITSTQLYSAAIDNPWQAMQEIHKAARTGNVAQLQTLLDSNPALLEERDYEYLTIWSFSPLHTAVYYLQLGSVEALLKRGADCKAVTTSNCNALHLLANRTPFDKPEEIEDQNSLTEPKKVAQRELAIAAIGKLLIAKGTPLDAISDTKRTPPQEAAWEGNYVLLELLIKINRSLINLPGRENLLLKVIGHSSNGAYGEQRNETNAVVTLLHLGAPIHLQTDGPNGAFSILDTALANANISPAKKLLLANAPITNNGIRYVKFYATQNTETFNGTDFLTFALACQELHGKTSIKETLTPEELENLRPAIDYQKTAILSNSDNAWLLHYGFRKKNPLALVGAIKRGFTGYQLRKQLAHRPTKQVGKIDNLNTNQEDEGAA